MYQPVEAPAYSYPTSSSHPLQSNPIPAPTLQKTPSFTAFASSPVQPVQPARTSPSLQYFTQASNQLPICPLSGDVSWTIHTVQSTQDNSQNIQATSPHAIIYRPISYQPAPVTQFDPHVHNLLVSAPVHHAHHAHPPPRWNIAKGTTDPKRH